MKLTGKCKEEFEKWYVITYFKDSMPLSIQEHCAILECFDDCFKSMRYGVLVDYFDSVGVYISLDWYKCHNPGYEYFETDINNYTLNERFNTRPEARTEAIEKANELRNEVLNK